MVVRAGPSTRRSRTLHRESLYSSVHQTSRLLALAYDPAVTDDAAACELMGDHYADRILAATSDSERSRILDELVDDFMAMVATRFPDMTASEVAAILELAEQRVGHNRMMLASPPTPN